MPRSRNGFKRTKIDPQNMKAAVEAVSRGEMSYRNACTVFGVKLATLTRQVQQRKSNSDQKYKYEVNTGHKKVFTDAEEKALVQYCITISRMQYGMSKKGLRELAFQFAVLRTKQFLPLGLNNLLLVKSGCVLSCTDIGILYLYGSQRQQV